MRVKSASARIAAAAITMIVIVATGVVAATSRDDDSVGRDAPDLPSAAEARALGAEWRKDRTAEKALGYAQALIGAGLYDDLLSEITVHGLFVGDAKTAKMFGAEARLRNGDYARALATADGADPWLSFIKARALYALSADATAASEALAAALRGTDALAAQAFLFRARLALDANDLETAEAAGRRAVELGADPRLTRDIALESAIRRGDLEAAAPTVEKRLQKRGDTEALRLAAMIALKEGDPRTASRLLDEWRLPNADANRVRLLAALAKWRNGDAAQAMALANAQLAAAPRDFIALDLAAAIAKDLGRKEDADNLLARLASERPALALWRRSSSLDEAYETAMRLSGDLSAHGAAFVLLGGDAGLAILSEPDSKFRRLVMVASALRSDDRFSSRTAAAAAIKDGDALSLALAGAAFAKIGDARADETLRRATAMAPPFYAPVRLRAAMVAERGDGAAAVAIVMHFLKANPSHVDARLRLATLQAEAGARSAAAQSFAAVPAAAIFADERAALLFAGTAKSPAAKRAILAAARDEASPLILGKVEALLGEMAAAAATFRRGLIDNPLHNELPGLYLAAMEREGRADEARSFLREIVRRRPEAKAARNALALADVEGPGIARF